MKEILKRLLGHDNKLAEGGRQCKSKDSLWKNTLEGRQRNQDMVSESHQDRESRKDLYIIVLR